MFVVAPRFAVVSPRALAVIGAGDPASSRLVYAMVVGLVLVGLALILLGVWILRQTRPDLEVLAPLERMGDREWMKRDPATQRRMLDEIRPDGAKPLWLAPSPPPLDADFEQTDHPVTSFSDLGPGVASEHSEQDEPKDPTPAALEVSDEELFADLETAADPEAAADPKAAADPEAAADQEVATEETLSDPEGSVLD